MGDQRSLLSWCQVKTTQMEEEEIAENQVNVATRQTNLTNALGAGDWEMGSWPNECSSIIDAGFNGWGIIQLCMVAKIHRIHEEFLP